MMIRSMPPASSDLAERPVPAPPPTIGTPSAIIVRNFSRMSCAAMAGMSVSHALRFRWKAATAASAKAGSLMCKRQADAAGGWSVCTSVCSIASNSAASACGIEEGAAFDVERRDALFRDEEADWPFAAIELSGDPLADLRGIRRRSCASASRWDCACRTGGRDSAPARSAGAQKLTMSSAPTEPT